MQKLFQGIHHFQANIFRPQKELFEMLARGQQPETLFITCSDSRINPNLITQTQPGELFIIRNAGNIIPAHGAQGGGEAATIEFAVSSMPLHDIIVCGHSHCGAMDSILNPAQLQELPLMTQWLTHAEAAKRIIRDKYSERQGEALLTTLVEENVLVQLENLRTHPVVASALSCGKLKLHGWVYKIETGEVFAFDWQKGQFVPVGEAGKGQIPPSKSLGLHL